MKVFDKRQRWIPEYAYIYIYIYIASPDITSFLLAILVYDGIFLTIFLRRDRPTRIFTINRRYNRRHARLYNLRVISGLPAKIPTRRNGKKRKKILFVRGTIHSKRSLLTLKEFIR